MRTALSMAYMAATGILLYGILRTHLFDADLKVKWTVRQSTVAGMFIGVFFVVTEGTQEFLAESGSAYVGIAVAGLLVFFLAPLQRLAERLSDRAMPDVAATPEYLTFRKLGVYKGALERAALDGVVTDRERAVLDRLRRDLGIANTDAAAMERDVLGPLGVAT